MRGQEVREQPLQARFPELASQMRQFKEVVQIVNRVAESADFAVIDDAEETEDATCAVTPSTQFVAVSAHPSAGAPVIYLSPDDGSADYRIFVRSKRFSAREAAALIVGAHGERPRLAAAL